MKLKIKKLHEDAKIPKYAHHDDAGFDLCAIQNTLIKIGERIPVPTGIAMEIPEGYVGLIWDKSGLSVKHGIKTIAGVIDSTYRGEILVAVTNLGKEDYLFEKGHKIAQMIIQKKETVEFEEVTKLIETVRGEGKFGSTGK
ncbi:MAG: dUTP diphosphatase [Minisyncoccia bacterium]